MYETLVSHIQLHYRHSYTLPIASSIRLQVCALGRPAAAAGSANTVTAGWRGGGAPGGLQQTVPPLHQPRLLLPCPVVCVPLSHMGF